MINFQVSYIMKSMEMDKKDPFQRLSKLLEEQGELIEAFFDKKDMIDSIEEAIDNLLVTASIAYVIDHDSLIDMESIFSFHYQDNLNYDLTSQFIKLTIKTGKISDAVQKYLKVGASCYKGIISKEDTISEIKEAIIILAYIIKSLVNMLELEKIEYVNDIIEMKNKKWLEKSIFGQQIQV
jgi:NTP pyrophosphatase (non-canonical NTP hydrolase)